MKKNLFFLLLIGFLLKLNSQTLYYPPLVGTTWDSILPSNLGYCQPRIDSLYNYLQAKNTKSFILLKDGKRVLEKYFGTFTRDSLWYWASASKSLASFITGIAQKQGYININNTVSQYIGAGWTSETLIKENLIRVSDLIKMTTGTNEIPPLPCTHVDTAKACLQYLADAGTRWAYHTGTYKKVQDVVSSAVGLNYNTITTQWIKNKIGMGTSLWFDQSFISNARDMARFGLLCLNKGIWANDTILKDSVYFKAMVNTSQNFNQSYGYCWWLNGKASFLVPMSQTVFPGPLIPNAPNDMYCALGKDDQKIYVAPGTKMVVVRQGNAADGQNLSLSTFDNTLWDYINKLSCPVGVNENSKNISLGIYPNPITNSCKITSSVPIKNLSVYDLTGRKCLEKKNVNAANPEINLSEFENGIYYLETIFESGIKSTTKLIKQ